MKEDFAGHVKYDNLLTAQPARIQTPIPVIKKNSLILFALWLSAFGPHGEVQAQASSLVREFPLMTNICQLRSAVSGNMGSLCAFSLEGMVLATIPDSGTLFFQDGSGTEILETGLKKPELQPGQIIRLQGTNFVTSTATGVSLGNQPVIDNDGWHGESECTATLYLKSGRYPIEVLWFNHAAKGSLNVAYSGPNLTRRAIPDTALFRLEKTSDGEMRFTNGLNYRCYEGDWKKLPFFPSLTPTKTGIASNFDLNIKTQDEYVGLAFDGFIEVETDGLYTFYLMSDDGSKLFLHNTPVQLTLAGSGAVPAPRQIAIRQPLSGEPGPFPAEVEGRVTFLGKLQSGVELELTSDDTHMRLVMCDGSGASPPYLLGGRVRVRGLCLDGPTIEGQKLADTLLIPDWRSIQVLDIAPKSWLVGKSLTIKDCKLREGQETNGIVRIRGKVRSHPSGRFTELEDDTGSVPVELLNAPAPQPDSEVECMGRWSRIGNSVLCEAVWRNLPNKIDNIGNGLPLLTTAAQVQQLNRVEAKRGYPAKIRGVVTWVAENRDCAVIQDSTRGVFVGLRSAWLWESPKVGEILEIEGTCVAGEFSPIIVLNKGERLGMGQLPAPVHPTWDQLIGGSMDSQYVEIRGLVTGAQGNQMTLLMPGGRIEVEFDPNPAISLDTLINSVVRVRGCLFAKWDHTTFQITLDHPLWFGSSTICVDASPPLDPFNVAKMRGKELMQYDVQRNFFQQVKISGQILQGRTRNFFLTDAGYGVRLQLAKSASFSPGDFVESVGLVQLGGASPVLQEAIAHKTGHAPLPEPQELVLDRTNGTADLTRVWVEGILVDSRGSEFERILEIQVGLKRFAARLPVSPAANMPWPLGSRLKLNGIYSDLGGDFRGRNGANAFELMVDSNTDVELVARPPWWTLNRLLTMITLLAAGLALAFIWIRLLQRQVDRRTIQLKREISERQRAEQDRAIEQERFRIAQDLHDDLGSSLTAISMLAITSLGKRLTLETSSERLQLIADKTRLMVTTLDGLVWAVNPKNDTVAALAEYLASFAEEFLARTGIRCRVELPLDFPKQNIAAEIRHNVLLSVREALNNAVRHGRPSEILLQLTFLKDELEIFIQDDGCGFDPARIVSGDGLLNLHERMRKVNGRCRIQSTPEKGTFVFLILPL